MQRLQSEAKQIIESKDEKIRNLCSKIREINDSNELKLEELKKQTKENDSEFKSMKQRIQVYDSDCRKYNEELQNAKSNYLRLQSEKDQQCEILQSTISLVRNFFSFFF
jgi:hypothetical protein